MTSMTQDQLIALMLLSVLASLGLVAACWGIFRVTAKILRWRKFYHLHRGRH